MAKNPSATNPRSTTKRTVKDQSGASKLKIGELLSKAGYITSAQFDELYEQVAHIRAKIGALVRYLESSTRRSPASTLNHKTGNEERGTRNS